MVYAIVFAILLIVALLFVTYQYAQESLEKDRAEENSKSLAKVASALQKELEIADKRLQESQEALVQSLIDNGDIDDVADLFNELLSRQDDNGKLPN